MLREATVATQIIFEEENQRVDAMLSLLSPRRYNSNFLFHQTSLL